MMGPGDSSLTATAMTSRSGHRNKRAMPDNAMSMILFTNEPLMWIARSRGKLLPLPTALSHRPFRSASGKRRSKILAGDGTEDARVAKFLNSTLRWRTTRTGNELTWPTARLWRSKGLASMKSTSSPCFFKKSVLIAHVHAQKVVELSPLKRASTKASVEAEHKSVDKVQSLIGLR